MFTEKTDLTLNSAFSSVHNVWLLSRDERWERLQEEKYPRLDDKPSGTDFPDEYLDYINDENKTFLKCIRCGRKFYPCSDEYDSSLLEYEEPSFLCERCRQELDKEFRDELDKELNHSEI